MRIMLVCSNGLSTSLVVSSMQEAAKAEGKNYKIWAIGQQNVQEELGNFDIVMVGPQVRYIQKRIQKLVENKIPVVVIDQIAYGRRDGVAVLKQAEDAVKGE